MKIASMLAWVGWCILGRADLGWWRAMGYLSLIMFSLRCLDNTGEDVRNIVG